MNTTNDERREVAARLRKVRLNNLAWCYGYNVYDGIEDAVGCAIGQDWQDIEPEPERTCNNIGKKDWAGFTTFECSECGEHFPAGETLKVTGYCSYWNYCPNCGAKVVSDDDACGD